MRLLIDTHALLWWALDPDQLSPDAAALCARMELEGGFASAISIWELAVKVERKKLELPLTIDDFVVRLEASGVIELVAVDAAIWMRAARLGWAHRDPADRVIFATAQIKGVPLLTKDSVLHEQEPSRCVW